MQRTVLACEVTESSSRTRDDALQGGETQQGEQAWSAEEGSHPLTGERVDKLETLVDGQASASVEKQVSS
jgi:hypothetical protein